MQGFEDQKGLFSPFPVLDKTEYLMETFVFKLKDFQADLRFEGMQPCMLLIFFPREYYFLFENRKEIEDFINEKIVEWEKIENLSIDTHQIFVNEMIKILENQI